MNRRIIQENDESNNRNASRARMEKLSLTRQLERKKKELLSQNPTVLYRDNPEFKEIANQLYVLHEGTQPMANWTLIAPTNWLP